MTWHMTDDRMTAMANDYIGEVYIQPKFNVALIRYMMTGKIMKPLLLFYYGVPDQHLCEMFGYDYPVMDTLKNGKQVIRTNKPFVTVTYK